MYLDDIHNTLPDSQTASSQQQQQSSTIKCVET